MKNLMMMGACSALLALAACGKKDKDEPVDTGASTSTATQTETTDKTAATDTADEANTSTEGTDTAAVPRGPSAADLAEMKRKARQEMAANGARDEVQVLASGLQYQVVEPGDPNAVSPLPTDKVRVNYEGRLMNGKVFDSSYERGVPAEFFLNQVIPGWTEGVGLMKPGAEYNLFIPYDLAYGEAGRPGIPPYSNLIFRVELIDIVTPAE